MTLRYRIVFETYEESDESSAISSNVLLDEKFKEATNILNFGMGQANQLELIKRAQDNFLKVRGEVLHKAQEYCPRCNKELAKFGFNKSNFHDVYSDHELRIQRMRCRACKYEAPNTIKAIFNTEISGDLARVQASLGATNTFREGEQMLSLFSGKERSINNHDRIKHVTEAVGEVVEVMNDEEKEMIKTKEVSELVLNVDGGHIQTVENKRSMEAITSVIYNPKCIKYNSKNTRNYITNKHCAASVKNDGQQSIISSTIVAALKQGIGSNTHVVGLSDGATNCWNVIEAIEPLCGKMTCILDWFHIGMKIQNIALPKDLKEKLEKVKWHLWRGNVETALSRLDDLIAKTKDNVVDKIKKFKNYILNNKDKIVDYESRKDKGQVFTSNLAEPTVESLINKRCKGQQHMRWSREGLNPVLQLRAAMHSKDWSHKWKDAVLNAFCH